MKDFKASKKSIFGIAILFIVFATIWLLLSWQKTSNISNNSISFCGIRFGRTLNLEIFKISLVVLYNHIEPVLGTEEIQKVLMLILHN